MNSNANDQHMRYKSLSIDDASDTESEIGARNINVANNDNNINNGDKPNEDKGNHYNNNENDNSNNSGQDNINDANDVNESQDNNGNNNNNNNNNNKDDGNDSKDNNNNNNNNNGNNNINDANDSKDNNGNNNSNNNINHANDSKENNNNNNGNNINIAQIFNTYLEKLKGAASSGNGKPLVNQINIVKKIHHPEWVNKYGEAFKDLIMEGFDELNNVIVNENNKKIKFVYYNIEVLKKAIKSRKLPALTNVVDHYLHHCDADDKKAHTKRIHRELRQVIRFKIEQWLRPPTSHTLRFIPNGWYIGELTGLEGMIATNDIWEWNDERKVYINQTYYYRVGSWYGQPEKHHIPYRENYVDDTKRKDVSSKDAFDWKYVKIGNVAGDDLRQGDDDSKLQFDLLEAIKTYLPKYKYKRECSVPGVCLYLNKNEYWKIKLVTQQSGSVKFVCIPDTCVNCMNKIFEDIISYMKRHKLSPVLIEYFENTQTYIPNSSSN